MAEVYWIHGFEKTPAQGQSLAAMVREWLDEIHVRVAWVNQVNVLVDGDEAGIQAELAEADLPVGFVFSSACMDEHFFFQQVLRRMRMDESESQLLVCQVAETVYGALFVSHRQVGKYNLLPRLVLAEQMAVLQPEQLQKRLTDLPEEFEKGVYLTAVDEELLSGLDIAEIEKVTKVATGKASLLSCLMEINQQDALKEQFGLLLSQAENQPLLVSSVQGC
jgi:hypothetical protein